MTRPTQPVSDTAGGNYPSVARNGFTPFLTATSVTQAFAHVVHACPDRRAIIAGELVLTYAELNGLADKVAAALRTMGATRGHGVGIYMNRSAEAIVAMLAILKLGAMYVPFDPAAPDERLESQAKAAAIGILAVAQKEPLPHWFEGTVLAVDLDLGGGVQPTRMLDIHPLELACVIHTSGSTNKAKGVCVTHRAILDLIAGAAYCSFTPDDIVYHGMSIAFDGSTFEIWGALLNGACLVVAPAAVSIQKISELVETHAVSVLLLSTGVFNALGQETLRRLGNTVRVFLAGGDVMSPHSAAQFFAAGGQVLVNGYGPTEVTTFSHCHVMLCAQQAVAPVPIGAPIHGTAAYVLDQQGAVLPEGAEGELFVAGTGLAQGYLGDPALTAERFIPDPFATDGSRMYRTGDLVRQSAGGVLGYIGRIDTQVKIRGFRVELGEIETCLRRIGQFEDVCVIHMKNAAGTSLLFAYGVPRHAAERASEQALLEQLRARLPDYMLPRRIIFVDALPLTINGKVDRRFLTARAADALDDMEVPNTIKEESGDPLVQSLMHELGRLLAQFPLVPSDNFFDAGGDSLTAMRFCALVDEKYAVELPLLALFEAESLGDLIEHVRALMTVLPAVETCDEEETT